MENSKSVILQCVRNRLRGVPTLSFDLENFGVLDEGSLMEGARLREMVAHGGSTVFTSPKEEHWQISNFCTAVVIYPSPWTQTPEKREEEV